MTHPGTWHWERDGARAELPTATLPFPTGVASNSKQRKIHDLQDHARSQQANCGTRARVCQTRTYRWISLATRWCFWDPTPLRTKLSELQASQTPRRCTRLLFYSAGHCNGLLDFTPTKLGGAWIDSSTRPVIVTAYLTSLQLSSGAWIQWWKIKFSSIQPLGDKWSLIIVFGGYSAAPLRTSTRSYRRLWVVGFRLGGYMIHILRGCIQISLARNYR
jgi:hypothetical protein